MLHDEQIEETTVTTIDNAAPDQPKRRDDYRVARSTREALERWARWRSGARYYGPYAGPRDVGGSSFIVQLLNGRGSTACPTCKGSGRRRIPGYLVGSQLEFMDIPCPQCGGLKRVSADLGAVSAKKTVDCKHCRIYDKASGSYRSLGELPNGRTCHVCRGATVRTLKRMQVHPATIKGTRHLGVEAPADPVSLLINRTVLEWQTRNETYWLSRVVVAEYCNNGTAEMKARAMDVSAAWFSKNLKEAHRRIEALLAGGFNDGGAQR